MLEKEVKWAKDVWEYMDHLKRTLVTMKPAVLSPDEVQFNFNNNNNNGNGNGNAEDEKYWIKLHSDKAQKHFDASDSPSDEKNKWHFGFAGGEHLKMAPIHSYAANGAGLTTAVANANVVPTLDLAVLMPVKSKFEDDADADDNDSGMIGGKDYLNGRYFDVSHVTFAIFIISIWEVWNSNSNIYKLCLISVPVPHDISHDISLTHTLLPLFPFRIIET